MHWHLTLSADNFQLYVQVPVTVALGAAAPATVVTRYSRPRP